MKMPEKEKKRKRDSEGDRPQKRVATSVTATPPSTVNVTFMPEQGEIGPVIVSTTGLSAPKDITFQAYKKRNPRSCSLRNEILLHSSEHPRLDYFAGEEKSGGADSHLKHYIGVYDPETSELKVVEVPRVVLRASLRPSDDELKALEGPAEKPNFASMRKTLGMEFGTKKAKKMIASITENAINRKTGEAGGVPADALASAVLDGLAETTSSMPTREERQAAVDEAKPRPKANLDADSPEDVYPLHSLISEEDLKTIWVKDWIDASAQGDEVVVASQYVAHRLYNMATREDNVRNLKALRYVYILLNFYTALLPRGNGKRLPKREHLKTVVGAPNAILEDITKSFCDGSQLSRWHVDKLILHILALTLIVDDFATDMLDIREDLRLDAKQIGQYYGELGCKVANPTEADRVNKLGGISKTQANSHRMAKLKLPLEFPKQRVMTAKKKR